MSNGGMVEQRSWAVDAPFVLRDVSLRLYLFRPKMA